MTDRAWVGRLWKNIRAAVHEFKMSRMQKRSDNRFWVVEVKKCERRRLSSSDYGPSLSARCYRLKRSVRKRAGEAAAALVECPHVIKNANATWRLISFRRAEEDYDVREVTEEDTSADEGAPISWTRRREVDIGEFSPQTDIVALSSWKSMEEFRSLKWEDGVLTSESAHSPGESSCGTSTSLDCRRWEDRFRVSNRSPQLLEPVRGKLTTLSSLLRTMSDRYARRTGKLASLHDKSRNQSFNNNRLLLSQSQSASPWPEALQQQQQNNLHRLNSTTGLLEDALVQRYDNPFQDFLRQSFADRHSRSVHETNCQR